MAAKEFLNALATADNATSKLADGNHVELAWFTRGALDAVGEVVAAAVGTGDNDVDADFESAGEYVRYYRAGYESVKKAAFNKGLI